MTSIATFCRTKANAAPQQLSERRRVRLQLAGRGTLTWLAVFLLAVGLQAQASVPAPDPAFISEIRLELACYCGCGMTVQGCLGGMSCSESRQLSQEVIQHVEAGMSKAEVLQAMVEKYGERILSAPTKEGFNLTAWILPFVALVLGVWIVAFVLSRWRHQAPAQAAPAGPSSPPPEDEYTRRLEEELRDYNQ